MSNKGTLNNIVLLRAIAIIGVVIYHSFSAVYNLNSENLYFNLIFRQSFMVLALNMAMIPLFTFISGYLYSYTSSKRTINFSKLLSLKFKRLIVPYLLFSVFFYIMTPQEKPFMVKELFLNILRGSDHLWFLLMLFFCFCAFYAIKKNKLSFIGLIFIYLLFFIIEDSDYYYLNKILSFKGFIIFFPWFCLGFFTQKYLEVINKQSILVSSMVFYISMIVYSIYTNCIFGGFVDNYKSYICQFIAIVILVLISTKIKFKENSLSFNFIFWINHYSFGIYIFHMWFIHFITKGGLLKEIAYKNAFYSPIILSIIIFVVSFTFSYIISVLFQRTNFGKTILG